MAYFTDMTRLIPLHQTARYISTLYFGFSSDSDCCAMSPLLWKISILFCGFYFAKWLLYWYWCILLFQVHPVTWAYTSHQTNIWETVRVWAMIISNVLYFNLSNNTHMYQPYRPIGPTLDLPFQQWNGPDTCNNQKAKPTSIWSPCNPNNVCHVLTIYTDNVCKYPLSEIHTRQKVSNEYKKCLTHLCWVEFFGSLDRSNSYIRIVWVFFFIIITMLCSSELNANVWI